MQINEVEMNKNVHLLKTSYPMKAIFIQKKNNSGKTPIIYDFDLIHQDAKKNLSPKKKLDDLHNLVNHKGIVTLLSQDDSDAFCEHLRKAYNYRLMQKNSRRIELYRALKLDQPVLLDVPKILKVDYSDIGSFKRSFTPFFQLRYLEEMAPVVLVIPGRIHEEMLLEKNWLNDSNKSLKVMADLDPFLQNWLENIIRKDEMIALKEEFAGISKESTLIRAFIRQAARSDSTVMLIGETGVGKSLIAKIIHRHSSRSGKNFVTVNCSAIPDNNFNALFFGDDNVNQKEGKSRKGLLEIANGGTLFLDEISELSPKNQTELLNILERGIFRTAFGNEYPVFNVRFIASTNSNLPLQVRLKSFKENLFYLLSGIQIIVPPLRERPEDIPEIASSIWKRIAPQPRSLNPSFLSYLKTKTWPGNMAEMAMNLENLLNIFDDSDPCAEGLESLQKIRNDQSVFHRGEISNYFKTLQHEYKNRLVESLNLIRRIRFYLRPLVNNDQSITKNNKEVQKINVSVHKELNALDKFLLDPIYFKDPALYNKIRCFRYDLDETLKKLPAIQESFHNIWQTQFENIYDDILHRVFSMIWDDKQRED